MDASTERPLDAEFHLEFPSREESAICQELAESCITDSMLSVPASSASLSDGTVSVAHKAKAAIIHTLARVLTGNAASCASISPARRLPIMLSICVFDIAGVVVTLALLTPGNSIVAYTTRAAMILAFAGQFAALSGLYSVESTTDLRRCVLGAGSLLTIAVPSAFLAWLLGYGSLVGHCVGSAAAGLSLGLIGRVACSIVVSLWSERLMERVLIIGSAGPVDALARLSRVAGQRVRIVGKVVVEDSIDHTATDLQSRGEDNMPVGSMMAQNLDRLPSGIDRVVITQAGLDDERINTILHSLDGLSAPIHILPGGASAVTSANDAWVIRGMPGKPGALLAKRSFDIAVGMVLLLIMLPFLLLTALLIRLESPGPALFRQTRLGRDNKPFTVLKLRTMRSDSVATDGSLQAVRGDARITRLGALLRKTSIDELPQLINVLGGSMSLVGPRPHPTELNRHYVRLVERYSARHRLAPGITGWAQVNGLRGETRTTEQMKRRVELDLEYIHGHSLGWDLWIIVRTVVSVLNMRNAY